MNEIRANPYLICIGRVSDLYCFALNRQVTLADLSILQIQLSPRTNAAGRTKHHYCSGLSRSGHNGNEHLGHGAKSLMHRLEMMKSIDFTGRHLMIRLTGVANYGARYDETGCPCSSLFAHAALIERDEAE